MKPTNVMEANVARGSALMDEKRPGWHNRIDLKKLDVSSGSYCVLGQDCGSYTRGLRKLGISRGSSEYGFCTGEGTSGRYRELTKLWKREIEVRRLRDIPVADESGAHVASGVVV